jgi:hypothetical protein
MLLKKQIKCVNTCENRLKYFHENSKKRCMLYVRIKRWIVNIEVIKKHHLIVRVRLLTCINETNNDICLVFG